MRSLALLAVLLPVMALGGPKGSSYSSSHSSAKSSSHSTSSSSHSSGASHSTTTKKSYSSSPSHSSTKTYKSSSHSSSSSKNRDPKQKAAFRKNHPCPSTGKTSGACPGYEVDHRNPLACGGSDSPGNMQWLAKAENRKKGAAGCKR